MLRTVILCLLLAGAAGLSAQKPKPGKHLYDVDHVVEVRLYFEQPDWAARLDSLKDAGEDERLTGRVVVDGVRYEQVGVRYKGNSSFNNVRKNGYDKLPLNIKINHVNRDQRLPGGFETLKLSNVFRDPSFLREVLSYEIARDYLPAPRANFARVFINDHYVGLYNSSESVDEKFLLDHYGSFTGTLVKCDPVWTKPPRSDCPPGDNASLQYLGEDTACYIGLYEMKSDTGWRDLVELARILEQEPNKLEDVLDIDQTLWMLAFNNVLVNLDSYDGMLCHNYYLYRDTFGVFHPIVWDMNLSFGGFRHTGEEPGALTSKQLQELSPFLHFRNEKRPLIRKLLAQPLYRKMYVAHLRTILQDHFLNGRYRERARAVQKSIDAHVKADTSKLYSYEAFLRNLDSTSRVDDQDIIGITELMEKRTAYLASHPLFTAEAPRIAGVEHELAGKSALVSARVQGADRCWLFFRSAGGAAFRRFPMNGHPADGEQTGEEILWTATIDAAPGGHYYVVAEGDKAASLSPERASREYHAIKR